MDLLGTEGVLHKYIYIYKCYTLYNKYNNKNNYEKCSKYMLSKKILNTNC